MPSWLQTVVNRLNVAWNNVAANITAEHVANWVSAVVMVVAGLVIARILSSILGRVLRRRVAAHAALIAQRAVYYGLLVLIAVQAMQTVGLQLSVLLGAAGILTVAIGFASQTSMSNLISGIFLIVEQPFVVSDIVKIGDTTGEVLSIDLLSLKLRTFDNLYVRIPNQTVINSEVVNLTHFPIRRVDLQIGVAYKEDLDHVRRVLLDVADRNPLCLEEPEPLYLFLGFGDSSLNLQFSVWTKSENFLTFKNSIQEEIKRAFDQQGIEIPFPHISLYTGSVTEPFPVRITGEPAAAPESNA